MSLIDRIVQKINSRLDSLIEKSIKNIFYENLKSIMKEEASNKEDLIKVINEAIINLDDSYVAIRKSLEMINNEMGQNNIPKYNDAIKEIIQKYNNNELKDEDHFYNLKWMQQTVLTKKI